MQQKYSWLFPVIDSAVLLGLYLLFIFFNDKYLNILLHNIFYLNNKEPFKTMGEQYFLQSLKFLILIQKYQK